MRRCIQVSFIVLELTIDIQSVTQFLPSLSPVGCILANFIDVRGRDLQDAGAGNGTSRSFAAGRVVCWSIAKHFGKLIAQRLRIVKLMIG